MSYSSFRYRSKIARDFVMSRPEKPDHVWEPQTTKLLLHLAGTVTDVIVGGAYFGDQAIPIANALRGRGTCHAFEADAVQASMIERNASINGLDNVRVNALGLWSQPATLRLVGHDALAGAAESETGIAATTIDAYARDLGIRIGLIMLDLEGGELHALRGASEQLARNAPYVVFEMHRSYVDWSRGLQNTEIVQFLTSLGYTIHAIRDFQSNYNLAGRPVELVPIETAYLEGPPHGFNLFAFRDAAVIDDELVPRRPQRQSETPVSPRSQTPSSGGRPVITVLGVIRLHRLRISFVICRRTESSIRRPRVMSVWRAATSGTSSIASV